MLVLYYFLNLRVFHKAFKEYTVDAEDRLDC